MSAAHVRLALMGSAGFGVALAAGFYLTKPFLKTMLTKGPQDFMDLDKARGGVTVVQ